MKAHWRRMAPPVVCLVLATAGLPVVWNLAERIGTTLALLAVSGAALCWCYRVLCRDARISLAMVLLVAAVLEVSLLPLPPTLSDDVLRYVWDGRVAAAGFDPYALSPSAEELAPLRDASWQRVPHRSVATVYPPLALTLFSIAARSPFPVLLLKAAAAVANLLTVALLWHLARRLGLPARRVVLFAWNPLLGLETVGMGHIDGIGVLASVATVALLVQGRKQLAGAATAACAVLAKLVPLVAVPIWARRSRRPAAFTLAVAGLCLVALAPVALSTGGVPPGLTRFAVSWEFNGPLFEPLWRGLDWVHAAAAVKGWLDALERLTGLYDWWNRFYPWVYPQLLAKLLLAGAFVALWPLGWRRLPVAAATGRVFGLLVLCSATVYPWYLVWVLPWAALCLHPAWLAAGWLVLLSYLAQFGSLPLIPWVYLAEWVPFGALLVWRPRWSID